MSRQMMDSGADWIGEMPCHWETTKLKYIFSIKKDISNELGHDILSVTQSGIKIKDISKNEGQISADYSKYQLVDIDDFVMNHMDLLTGWVDCSSYQGVTSPDYRVFKLLDAGSYCKEFYTYLFQACYMNKVFYGLGQGVSNLGRWRLQTDKFLNFILPKFPLTEQQAIAEYLDHRCAEIDNIIKNTKSSIEEYKAYKQAVITESVSKGLNPNVLMKKSGIEWIGEIPEHWRVTRVKYLLDESKEKSIKGIEEPLSMSQQFGVIKSSELDIPNPTSSYIGGKLVYKDFLVFNKLKAHLGVFAVSPYSGVVSPDYAVYVGKEGASVKFLEYLFKTQKCIQQFKKYIRGVGAGLSRLYTSDLFNIKIALPNYHEQVAITDFIEKKCVEIDNLILQKKQLISELETYKKSLIYECVTGKLNVGVTETKQISIPIHPIFPALLATNKKRFAQAVLASKVIDVAHTSQLGRVKLEKILYTIETHIGFDFDTDYKRQIAGPLDGSIYQCENMISQRNKWFRINVTKSSVKYSPAKDMANYKKYYQKYYVNYAGEIDRIINIFNSLSTDEAEIFATLYASWNDFVICGGAFTDEDIVSDVLNNWHESKKRFSKDTWLHAIEQMKQLELVPRGYGKKTIIE
ncbi:restriction endonuclease subunit S [Cohnella terricola]|uniref:Type I restriction modification DNA specificity domain-containing protein n=1 Tax=Cohnella terricola TaxID=1289167 RepID=A0A559JDJ9_9BACL|nr:restriction endonuclease subunit S [Cohnella terricola]TVX97943.1 hypothetical protein FPZ45_17000 [Cohnella terricola]